MPTDGWFKTYRTLFTHPLFAGDEACRAHAFNDLVGMAEYESSSRGVKGHVVKLERGEVFASIRFLGERWGWSNGKVQRFLARLEAEKMVFEVRAETVPDRGTPLGTVYRIANYDTYQAPPDDSRNDQRNGNGTATGQIERSKESTSTTTGAVASEMETAKLEMWADFDRSAEGLAGFERLKAEALVRGIIDGDTTKCWEVESGDRVPWSERPRLLRLAMDEAKANRSKIFNALRYTVVPREMDAYRQAKSTDSKPKPGTESAAVRSETPGQYRPPSVSSGLSLVGAMPKPESKPTRNLDDERIARWEAENMERAASIMAGIERDNPSGASWSKQSMNKAAYRARVLKIISSKESAA